ncbi:MAG: PKD domain-containing protein [Bacteroidia bacterium]|nr:PKD domain-containing protein [Bacteroidia bacterium]
MNRFYSLSLHRKLFSKIFLTFSLILISCYVSAQPVAQFIENKGQWHENILYYTPFTTGSMFLEKSKITYVFYDSASIAEKGHAHHQHNPKGEKHDETIKGHAYTVSFLHPEPGTFTAPSRPFITKNHYYLGNDPKKWAENVSLYENVAYKGVWKGIDVAFYSKEGKLKYDFLLQPGSDPSQIQLKYDGLESGKMKITGSGNLQIETSVNTVTEFKPYAFQFINSKEIPVPCEYSLIENVLSFHFSGDINPDYPLTIDPTVIFSTYTGSTQDNWGFTATYDNVGNAFGGGIIYSGGIFGATGYPTTAGAFQTFYQGGGRDAAITKYNPLGTALLFSTYLGGDVDDQPHSMVVNSLGQLIVMGRTNSFNFPTTSGVYDQSQNGGFDIFVSKFSPTGTMLASTFVGGNLDDANNNANGVISYNYSDDARGEIIVDASDDVYIASCTQSFNFPVSPGAVQNTLSGFQDGVVLKMDGNLSSLMWSTYLGGNLLDAAYGLKTDNGGNVFVTGGTTSINFPVTPGAYQTVYNGGNIDGFITKINNTGTALLASTFIGTNSHDQSYLIQEDVSGNIYVTGQTLGAFPVIAAAYSNPGSKHFIAKLDNNLSAVSMSTIFGAPNVSQINISPTAFLVDNCENIYVAGWGGQVNQFGLGGIVSTTNSMPVSNPTYQNFTDGSDFYVIVLTPNAAGLLYATYFGGNGTTEHVDGGTSRFDPNGIIYEAVCAGCGGSDLFPTTPGAWSNFNNSTNCNLGVFKIDFAFVTVVSAITAPASACVNAPVNFVNNSVGASTYSWNFGDGNTSTATSPTHSYSTAGTYTVTLIAYPSPGNSCSGPDTTTTTILINPLPVPSLTMPASICIGNTATVTYTGSSVSTYTWNFGSGVANPGTGIGPHTVTWGLGQHVVTLSVTDVNGCSAGPISNTIDVIPLPTANFNLTDTVCLGADAIATYLGNAPASATYNWNFSGGTAFPGGTVQGPHSVSWATPGYHLVSLVVTANGCTSPPFVDSVYVLNATAVTFTLPDSACLGQTVQAVYNGPNSPGTVYHWDFGAATGGAQTAGPHTLTFPLGSHSVSVWVESSQGCGSDTFYQDIVIHPIPTSLFSAPDSLCFGNTATVTYTGSATAGAIYNWNFGLANAVPTGGQGPIVLSFPLAANYPVSLIVSEHGCVSPPTSDMITINPIPVADFVMPDSACIFQDINVNYSGQVFSNQIFHWNFGTASGGGTGQGPFTLQWSTSGTQSVSLWVESAGCPSDTVVRSIFIKDGPPASILVAPTDICISDSSVVFYTGSLNPGYQYFWNFAGGLATPGTGPGPHTVHWLSGGVKDITLSIVENGCPGLPDSAVVNVYTPPTADFAFPDSICIFDANQVVFTGNASVNGAYSWDFGSAVWLSGSGQGPYVLSWTTSGIHQICVQVTESACPPSTQTCHDFLVLDKPVADILPVANQCFINNSFNFTFTGSGAADAYYWGFPNGVPAFSSAASPTGIHYNSPGQYYAWVYIVRNGCTSDTAYVYYEVVPEPSTNFLHTGVPYCVGSCINFTYTGQPVYPQQAYYWNFGGAASPVNSTLTNPGCVYFTQPGPQNVSLVINHKGCLDTSVQTLFVNPSPQVSAGADIGFCEGLGPVQLNATTSSGTPPYNFSWFSIPVAGGISNPYVEDPFVNPQDSAIYIIQVQDGFGCLSNYDTAIVAQLPRPKVYAGPDQKLCDYPGAPGVNLQGGLAQDNEAPGPFHFQWSPTTGMNPGQDTLANAYVHPSQTTIYTLVVTSIYGCQSDPLDTASTVTVDVIPVPTVEAGPTLEMCKGDTVQFLGYATGGGPYTYSWTPDTPEAGVIDNSDPQSLVSPDYTHTYTLMVGSGGCYGSDTVSVVVHTLPTAAVQPVVTDICQRDSLLINGLAFGDPFGTLYEYEWIPNSYIADNHNPVTYVYPPTTSDYILQVATPFCIGYVDTVTIHVRSTPLALITNPDTLICEGEEVHLQVNFSFNGTPVAPAGSIVYDWTPDESLTAGFIPNPWASPTQTTTYIATVSVAGNCATSDSVTITVAPKPDAQIQADTTTLCGNQTTFLYGSGGQGAAIYSWSPVNGLDNPSSPTTQASPDSSAIYTLWVTEGLCKDSASVAITVNPQPVSDYYFTNASGCAPLTVQFTQNATNALSYVWNFNDGSPVMNIPSLYHTFDTPGNYPVSLTVTGNGGCVSEVVNATVVVYPSPVANFESNPSASSGILLPAGTVSFTNLSQNSTNWYWSFSPGVFSLEKNPVYQFTTPGMYPVMLIAYNETGCVDTLVKTYNVEQPDLFIPNVFSPNNDGFYDEWLVQYSGTESYQLVIYDRWGVKYFIADTPLESWNGLTLSGKPASDGVYYYALRIGSKVYNGNVTLMR